LIIAALAAAGLLALAGCTSSSNPSPPAPATLPAGADLIAQSATAMAAVTSAHLTIDSSGDIGSVPLRSAVGDITRSGDAKGSIKLMVLGVLLQEDFVVVGGNYYLKGLTGGWQKEPANAIASLYDPTAVLDPNRGVAKILATATVATTEAADSTNGVDTYRVVVDLNSTAVSSIVPGIPAGITGHLWIDRSTKHLVRAQLTVPSAASGPSGVVTINLSDLDKPVTVSAPI
jgi:lipoprotein LprG